MNTISRTTTLPQLFDVEQPVEVGRPDAPDRNQEVFCQKMASLLLGSNTDLQPEFADALELEDALMDDAPLADIRDAVNEMAPCYGANPVADSRMMRRVVMMAMPYFQALEDNATEFEVKDAFRKGAKICLLADWLVENRGMKAFPAMLKAVSMEGELPDEAQGELGNLSIVRG